uniref:Chromatin-remodeling complex ATPase chain Iswi n=1 Tax=Rhabditophanes sp. KR3021 TaxID=114890 RepID=A0AC35TTL7_9BILA
MTDSTPNEEVSMEVDEIIPSQPISQEDDIAPEEDHEIIHDPEDEDYVEERVVKKAAPVKKIDIPSDSFDRFQELLRKTETFSKNLATGRITASKKDVKTVIGDNRHRKTEKEEDEELLAAEQSNGKAAYMFTNNPPFIKGEMRDYQIRGLNWLINLEFNGVSGVLADEMGLGKTLQTISLLGYMKHLRKLDGPFLIIVPKSVLNNWINEVAKFCPTLRTVSLIGDEASRNEVIKNRILTLDFDIVATTYEMILKTITQLKKIKWEYVIIDEAHRIKNEKSKLSEMVRLLNSNNRLLITGTPLQNNLHELWALLNFLLPDLFNNSEDFDSWFTNENCLGNNEEVVKRLHQVLQPFLLRRLKSDVEKGLLPKIELKVFVGLSKMQREWYTKILMKELDIINGAGKVEKTRLMNILMHLRKCCNHPYLFDGAEPGPPYTTDKHLVDNCGKMVLLDKLLKKFKEQGSRVLIFSQMSRMLDLFEDYCWWREYKYCRLDGQTAHEDRQKSIDDFNSEGSDKFIFMLTTRAGGLGINLTSADVVILYDSDWNPQMDLQAQDRAHRLGQKKQVRVFRLITEATVDERIIEKAEMKLCLDNIVIQQGRLSEAQKTLGKDEMLNMIRQGADAVIASKDATITDDDIDTILAAAEKKTAEMKEKIGVASEKNLRNMAFDVDEASQDGTKKKLGVYNFEGEDYKEKQKMKSNLPSFWIEPPKRERKQFYEYNKFNEAKTSKKSNRPPRPKNQPDVKEFQFYPKRCYQLVEKENLYYRKSINWTVPLNTTITNEKAALKKQSTEQKKIDSAKALTKAEIQEKERLLTEGFPGWNKGEYVAFVKACEKHGRKDIQSIAAEIPTKSFKEVDAYSKIFWIKIHTLKEKDKILNNVKKGENRLRKTKSVQKAIDKGINECISPLDQLNLFSHAGAKQKLFTPEDDRFLLIQMSEIGWQNEASPEIIAERIRSHTKYRWDFRMISRTPDDIRNRVNQLLAIIERNMKKTEWVLHQDVARINDQSDDEENVDSSKDGKKPKKRKHEDSVAEEVEDGEEDNDGQSVAGSEIAAIGADYSSDDEQETTDEEVEHDESDAEVQIALPVKKAKAAPTPKKVATPKVPKQVTKKPPKVTPARPITPDDGSRRRSTRIRATRN